MRPSCQIANADPGATRGGPDVGERLPDEVEPRSAPTVDGGHRIGPFPRIRAHQRTASPSASATATGLA